MSTVGQWWPCSVACCQVNPGLLLALWHHMSLILFFLTSESWCCMLCLVPRLLTAAGLPVRINDVIRWLEHGRGLSYTCPLGLGVTFLETQLASAPLGPDFLVLDVPSLSLPLPLYTSQVVCVGCLCPRAFPRSEKQFPIEAAGVTWWLCSELPGRHLLPVSCRLPVPSGSCERKFLSSRCCPFCVCGSVAPAACLASFCH